jgi:hypothetical protein
MGLFDIFRRKPVTVLDALRRSPEFQRQNELFEAMSAICEDGTDRDEMPNGEGEYGLVSGNPVPCRTVFGSTSLLGKLRAPDGTKVIFERIGSEISSVSAFSIDKYRITHVSGQPLPAVFISPTRSEIQRSLQRDSSSRRVRLNSLFRLSKSL